METLDSDTKQMLQHAGAYQLVGQLDQSTNPTNSSGEATIRNAYAQLTKDEMKLFESRFRKDMDFFGYERPTAITTFKPQAKDIQDIADKIIFLNNMENRPGPLDLSSEKIGVKP